MQPRSRFGRDFYARDTLVVARSLLGQSLFHDTSHGRRAGRIVEVEAYTGASDPASHAFRGPTLRSRIMFGPPGHLYVYFIYGMYHCCNVVTERDGKAGAVLIRALEPVPALAGSRSRTGRPRTDGPGKVCRALGITLTHNGVDLTTGAIGIAPGAMPAGEVLIGPRIGISRGAALPYRFRLRG
jgi:DNA-3-methyladenine glycosylase